MGTNTTADRYDSDLKHYESEEIVSVWLNSYEVEKERQFIQCIDRFLPQERLSLLDIGCGTGLHTFLWSERNKAVTASDFSSKFRDHILRTYRFPFLWMDVLNWTLDQQYDICFSMGVATILLDEPRRFQTFETLARLVRPYRFLVLVFGSNQWPFRSVSGHGGLHCINGRDIRKLQELGFSLERMFYWSSSPRFLWRSPFLRPVARVIEELGSCLGIGARKVVICRRRAGRSGNE